MCRVKYASITNGLAPSEKVVYVPSADGSEEEVPLSENQVRTSEGAFEASLIHQDAERVLVELPRESASGKRRMWVNRAQLVRG